MKRLRTFLQILSWIYSTGSGLALLVNTGEAVHDYPYDGCAIPSVGLGSAAKTYVFDGSSRQGSTSQDCSGRFQPGAAYLAAVVFWLAYAIAGAWHHIMVWEGRGRGPPKWLAWVQGVLKVLVAGCVAGASLKPESSESPKDPSDPESPFYLRCVEFTDLRMAGAVLGMAVIGAAFLFGLCLFAKVFDRSADWTSLVVDTVVRYGAFAGTVAGLFTIGLAVVGVHGLTMWAKDQISSRLFASLYMGSLVEEAVLFAAAVYGVDD